ncbi:MAG: cytochrome c family protein [Sphingopyxis sp.]
MSVRVALAGVLMLAMTACGGNEKTPAGSASTAAATPAATPAAPVASVAPAAAPATAVPAPTATLASLTGDAAKGRTLFNQCRTCHSDVAGTNGIGPSLHGVIGRTAGSVPGYAYSPANKASHRTWDRAALFTYLESPMRSIPGTKMTFLMANPQQRADVIAYLETLH